ncbi:MAG: ATP-binding protein [Verrucomicrobiaceae bacterium]|nr:MAG: ATP-binding protein [Verrucomicrobiaceae bacterium]
MLLDFQVVNHRSLRHPARLTLAASHYDSTSLPGNVITPRLPGITKDKFLRGAAVYGANASGKSNLIRAVFALQQLVRRSHAFELGGKLPFDPFLLDSGSALQPTLYAIRFVAEGVRYHYHLAFNAERVLEESLSAFPKGKEQLWYHRQWDGEAGSEIYSPEESAHFTLRKSDVESTKPNSLFLSTAANLNHPGLAPVYGWFRDTLSVLNLGIDSIQADMSRTLELYKTDPGRLLRLLREADLGISDLRVEKTPVPAAVLRKLPQELRDKAPAELTLVELLHIGEGGKGRYLPLDEESSGTKRYFQLMGPLIDLIEKGQVLFLDELETSLHPLLTRELVRMVMDPELNPKNAQIIFATHDPLLLDTTLLRRDQIWLTEKTPEGDSVLYALNEYRDPPTKRESLVRGYLAGRYGGIPCLPESLLAPEPLTTRAEAAET